MLKTDNKISKCVRLGENGNTATKRSSSPLLTNIGPRHTQQARKGPIPSFANFETHGNGLGCLVPARCSGGVSVGNVPDQNCSHLECSRRNNLYVQTCTKGGRAGLTMCSTASARTAATKCRYGRVPHVANDNSEVSWVVPARVIRPEPL